MAATMPIGCRQLGKNLREVFSSQIKSQGWEAGEVSFKEHVSKLIKKHGHSIFSIRALAEGIMGEGWEHKMKSGAVHLQRGFLESVSAIDLSAFSNITGQILIDRVRENYNGPAFIGDSLMETIPIVNNNLGPHIEPWLSRVKDPPSVMQPQQMYPSTQYIEQYITLVAPEKRGLRCDVSLEMIYGDKTKQAVKQAEDIGYSTRFDKEERQLRVVIGVTNNFTYMATTYNTYGTSGLWVNKVASNQILNYQGLAAIELLFSNMTDWVTGKAIMVDPSKMTLLCVPYKVPELKIATHAARTRLGQFPTSAAPTNAQSEYEGVPTINDVDYPIVKSNILWHLLTDAAPYGQAISSTNAKEYVWLGDFKKAFYYREVIPFTTAQAPPGNPMEFDQDIVVSVKCMEWGAPGVQDPRQVTQSING